MGQTVIIYHGGCSDGFTAAWAAQKAHPGARLVAASHGEPAPVDLAADDDVIVVDFAFPAAEHDRLAERVGELRVYDHHKTAAADIGDRPGTHFDMERSGAGIAWDELVGGQRPWLIDYVEARDLWRLDAHPRLSEVSAYVGTRPHRLEEWDALAAMTVDEVAELGRGAEAQAISNARSAVRRAHLAELATEPPVTIPLMNLGTGVSDACDMLLEASGADIVGYWYQSSDGQHQYGLRSRPDVDCSPIATHFGGGGHAQACGFRTRRPSHSYLGPLKVVPKAAEDD